MKNRAKHTTGTVPLAEPETGQQSRPKPGVRFGLLNGKFKVPEDFDAPMPEDLLEQFEGRDACSTGAALSRAGSTRGQKA